MSDALLEVSDLTVRFPLPRPRPFAARPVLTAVDRVSLTVPAGGALGLVGESGSGKSTTARAIAQLLRPDAGSVRLDGMELTALRGAALRRRRRPLQMVFQDPYGALDPRMTAAQIVAEPLHGFGIAAGAEARRRVLDLLERVGLDPAYGSRYPHEFSGGQRQRIGIARALAAEPRLLICDEPVSALDVSVQAQIINLLLRLRRELGIALLFIAHDLAVVRHVAERVAVMHRGRIVEEGAVDEVLVTPRHPYTQRLLAAVPIPDPSAAERWRAAAEAGP